MSLAHEGTIQFCYSVGLHHRHRHLSQQTLKTVALVGASRLFLLFLPLVAHPDAGRQRSKEGAGAGMCPPLVRSSSTPPPFTKGPHQHLLGLTEAGPKRILAFTKRGKSENRPRRCLAASLGRGGVRPRPEAPRAPSRRSALSVSPRSPEFELRLRGSALCALRFCAPRVYCALVSF